MPEHGYSRRVTRLLATQPGPESGCLLEGEFVLLVDGEPPKPLKAGESYGALPSLLTTPKRAQAAPRFWQCTPCAKASRWRLRQSSVYEYVWFREAPHLRLPLVRENEMATVPVADLMAKAKKVAMLENASLLNVAA